MPEAAGVASNILIKLHLHKVYRKLYAKFKISSLFNNRDLDFRTNKLGLVGSANGRDRDKYALCVEKVLKHLKYTEYNIYLVYKKNDLPSNKLISCKSIQRFFRMIHTRHTLNETFSHICKALL